MGADAFETVEKIPTDEKRLHSHSLSSVCLEDMLKFTHKKVQ